MAGKRKPEASQKPIEQYEHRVQMVYFEPPYGIKCGRSFQPVALVEAC